MKWNQQPSCASTDNIKPHHAALVGGFLLDGALEVAKPDAIREAWDNGWFEFVDELTRYAPALAVIELKGVELCEHNFPGVYAYEVINPVGRQFAAYIMAEEQAPTGSLVKDWIFAEAYAFFSRGVETPDLKNLWEGLKKEAESLEL